MPDFGPCYMPDKWCLGSDMYTEEVQSTLSSTEIPCERYDDTRGR